MIDSYDFGQIIIDGRRYTTDVIIFQDRVRDGWWRKEGHRLHVEDLEEALREKPEVLIVGTGYSELMKIPSEIKKHLESEGINLIAQRTTEACKTYNRLIQSKRVVAALHLTC